MTVRFLVGKFLRFHLAAGLGLAGTALVLSAAFTTANVLQSSVNAATTQSVSADAGGRDFAVQILDRQTTLEVLSRRTDLMPVIDRTASITAANAISPADLRVVADPAADLGLLVKGRHPARPGEATISSHLAEVLHLRVGDTAVVSGQELRVSGITSSPAHDDDLTVVSLVADVSPAEATIFLTDTDPFADRELGPLLDRRVLKGRTVAILAKDEGSSTRSAVLSTLSYAGPALGAVSISLILVLLGILAHRTRRDAAALQASGMTRLRSWRTIGRAGAIAVLAGTAAGAALALAATAYWRSPLSSVFGQDWRMIAVSWFSFGLYVLGVPALVFAAVHLAAAYRGGWWRRVRARLTISVRAAAWVLAACAVVLGLTIARVLPVEAGGIACAAATVAVPVLLARLVGRGAGAAEKRVVRLVAGTMLPLLLAAAPLTWLATSQSAGASHNAISMRETSPAAQPAGSLLLTEVPSSSSGALRDEYSRLGGKRVVTYRLPDESGNAVRAASAQLVGCMKSAHVTDVNEVDPSCFPYDSIAPVNIVALSAAGSGESVTADPSLIERGVVGLITFPAADNGVPRIDETPAAGDAMLGGNMPGAVLPADGALARSLNLRPSDGEFLAFLDFGDLPVVAQAQFRSDVARLASAAQVAEERDQYVGAAIHAALSRAWSAAGALLVAVLLGFGGATIVSAQVRLRRSLIDIGSLPRRRRLLVARIFALPMASIVFATALGLTSAWLLGVHNGIGFGWIWLAPGAAAFATIVGLGVAFHRVPPHTVTA